MGSTPVAAFNELAASVQREQEAQKASEAANAAAEIAFNALQSARVERSQAHERLLQLARSSVESPAQQ